MAVKLTPTAIHRCRMLPLVRIEEQWFEPRPPSDHVDVLRILNAYDPLIGFSSIRTSQTRVIDLSKDEAALLADFHKNTRYEIRRAGDEDLLFDLRVDDVDSVLSDFSAAYGELQKAKQLEPLRMKRLRTLGRNGSLSISSMSDASGARLCWHVYVTQPGRVRLLHSVSLFRSEDRDRQALIGRANRLLHWKDMCAWKARGVGLYDFGGEYHGEEDAAQVRIAAFKRGFGGEVVPIYSGIRGITLVGRLALEAARLRGAMHRARDGSRKAA